MRMREHSIHNYFKILLSQKDLNHYSRNTHTIPITNILHLTLRGTLYSRTESCQGSRAMINLKHMMLPHLDRIYSQRMLVRMDLKQMTAIMDRTSQRLTNLLQGMSLPRRTQVVQIRPQHHLSISPHSTPVSRTRRGTTITASM